MRDALTAEDGAHPFAIPWRHPGRRATFCLQVVTPGAYLAGNRRTRGGLAPSCAS